jgi:hypothetical protein
LADVVIHALGAKDPGLIRIVRAATAGRRRAGKPFYKS